MAGECKLKYVYNPFGGSNVRLVCDYSRGQAPTPKKPKRKAKRDDPPTRSQLRTLRFKRSAAATEQVQDDLVRRLASGDDAASVEALIRSGDLLRQANRQLRASGWSTSDLGDAYAKAYIVMWLVANPGPGSTSKRVDEAVRKDLRNELASKSHVRRWSDARQQRYADRLSSWTTVIAGSLNEYRRNGTPADVRDWEHQARVLAGQRYLLNVDLLTVRLTTRGVVRR